MKSFRSQDKKDKAIELLVDNVVFVAIKRVIAEKDSKKRKRDESDLDSDESLIQIQKVKRGLLTKTELLYQLLKSFLMMVPNLTIIPLFPTLILLPPQ